MPGCRSKRCANSLALLNLPEEVNVEVEETHKGALRATLVTVNAPESHHHRHLADIQEMIGEQRAARTGETRQPGGFPGAGRSRGRACTASRRITCISMRWARWIRSRMWSARRSGCTTWGSSACTPPRCRTAAGR